jgi:U32 family peptidase
MKLIIMPRSKQEILNTKELVDGYMLGIENLSINMPNYFSEVELFNILEEIKDKEIFISLNKNMHNKDIPLLKKLMIKLDNYKVNIAYYDIAVVNIKREHNLNNDLVWYQEHLTNNYITSNYWYQYGAKYTVLSNEITKEEIIEIKENAKGLIMYQIFGYLPMFVSRRHLVKNYLETFDLKDDSSMYFLEHKGEIYPTIDNEDGTVSYNSKILNGIKEVPNLNLDYIILNSFMIEENIFLDIVKMYKNVNKDNILEYEEIINKKLNTDYGFLYKETVYKVKKND